MDHQTVKYSICHFHSATKESLSESLHVSKMFQISILKSAQSFKFGV